MYRGPSNHRPKTATATGRNGRRHEWQVDNTVGTLCDVAHMLTARSLLFSLTSVTNGVPTTMRGWEPGSNSGIA